MTVDSLKKWMKENPERVKINKRRYAFKHREKLIEKRRLYIKENRDEINIKNKEAYWGNNQKRIFTACRKRCKAGGVPFDLTFDDVAIPEVCPVLGLPLSNDRNQSRDFRPSIDRVDNQKGYTKDNTRIISHRANRIKSDASIDEIRAIYEYMLSHQNQNNEPVSLQTS